MAPRRRRPLPHILPLTHARTCSRNLCHTVLARPLVRRCPPPPRLDPSQHTDQIRSARAKSHALRTWRIHTEKKNMYFHSGWHQRGMYSGFLGTPFTTSFPSYSLGVRVGQVMKHTTHHKPHYPPTSFPSWLLISSVIHPRQKRIAGPILRLPLVWSLLGHTSSRCVTCLHNLSSTTLPGTARCHTADRMNSTVTCSSHHVKEVSMRSITNKHDLLTLRDEPRSPSESCSPVALYFLKRARDDGLITIVKNPAGIQRAQHHVSAIQCY